ncbi:hypothetical protein LJC55_03490 [Eubacteriales bacterium OttesenSCG-928-N14]|nr:hypothetical protein [Eubacteriales bacterium OttesenSCG-928-N14]
MKNNKDYTYMAINAIHDMEKHIQEVLENTASEQQVKASAAFSELEFLSMLKEYYEGRGTAIMAETPVEAALLNAFRFLLDTESENIAVEAIALWTKIICAARAVSLELPIRPIVSGDKEQ